MAVRRMEGKPPPRFLYRYSHIDPNEQKSIDHARDIIVRSRLWLSSPRDFNDPFDMKYDLSVDDPKAAKIRLDKMGKQLGIPFSKREKRKRQIFRSGKRQASQKLQQIADRVTENVGICSFADKPRNILMWSHYARHHTGICYVFDVYRDPNTFFRAIPVRYSDTYPIVQYGKDFENNLS